MVPAGMAFKINIQVSYQWHPQSQTQPPLLELEPSLAMLKN